jgi:hypothetical protein
VTKRLSKSRSIIAAEDVAGTFDDACIKRLAQIARLPIDADLMALGDGVRAAVRSFSSEARLPDVYQVRDEIGGLLKLADPPRRKSLHWERIAEALESLSPKAREILTRRGKRPSVATSLPTPGALLDPEQREMARLAIARLCQLGGKYVKGRRRSSGKQSRPTWRPLIVAAPEPRKNLPAPKPHKRPPRRDAERNFVMWLQIAWLETTCAKPSLTARHAELPLSGRDIGPFARFARECLRLVGAGHVDVVELINELNRRRRKQAAGKR